jgi:chromate reductase, NAD(P)H dehydrogenase (quinone)
MRVLAIAGSLRRGSHNAALLDAAAREVPESAEWERFEGLREVPAYDADLDRDPAPASVTRLRAAIDDTDAVLIATPEYNASIPGALKNAIDWASRPYPDNVLRDKPVAVIGASTGIFGAVWAQAELRKVLHHAGAHVREEELSVGSAAQAFDEDGGLRDPELAERLADIVAALLREARAPIELAA